MLVPVGPVEVVAEEGEAEGVRHHVGEDNAPVAAVVVAHLDPVRLGVAPVDLNKYLALKSHNLLTMHLLPHTYLLLPCISFLQIN